MRTRVFIGTIALIAMAVITACDTGSSNPASGILVQNTSTSKFVDQLYATEVTNSSWGDDHMGSSAPVGPGESFMISLAPGQYDLRVVLTDSSYATLWDIVVSSAPVTVTAGESGVTLASRVRSFSTTPETSRTK
jgi:hypothetical protein